MQQQPNPEVRSSEMTEPSLFLVKTAELFDRIDALYASRCRVVEKISRFDEDYQHRTRPAQWPKLTTT